MALHQLHASYILRLEQRLSRLIFELRDVRNGQTWQFESTKALSSFLDATISDRPGEPAPRLDVGEPGWNAFGTAGRHPESKGERK